MNTFFKLDEFNRTKTQNIQKVLVRIEQTKRAKYEPIFTNIFCVSLSWILATVGTCMLSAMLVLDLIYVSTQIMVSHGLFIFYCILLACRFIGPFLNILRVHYLGEEALQRANTASLKAADSSDDEGQVKHFKRNGFLLYLALPVSQITGIYRFTNFKNFHTEVAFGLGADSLLNMLIMLFVQVVNNSKLKSEAAMREVELELTTIQQQAVILKLPILAILTVETFLFIAQSRQYHLQLRQAKVHNFKVQMSER